MYTHTPTHPHTHTHTHVYICVYRSIDRGWTENLSIRRMDRLSYLHGQMVSVHASFPPFFIIIIIIPSVHPSFPSSIYLSIQASVKLSKCSWSPCVSRSRPRCQQKTWLPATPCRPCSLLSQGTICDIIYIIIYTGIGYTTYDLYIIWFIYHVCFIYHI